MLDFVFCWKNKTESANPNAGQLATSTCPQATSTTWHQRPKSWAHWHGRHHPPGHHRRCRLHLRHQHGERHHPSPLAVRLDQRGHVVQIDLLPVTRAFACAAVRSNLVEVGAGDVDPSHDQVGADVTLVPGQANLLNLTNHLLTIAKTPYIIASLLKVSMPLCCIVW